MRSDGRQLASPLRSAVILSAFAALVAMTSGLLLAIHLNSLEHRADHDAQDCSFCRICWFPRGSSCPAHAWNSSAPPAPLTGDLAVDGRVDSADLAEFSRYWLSPESSRRNDYCERADADRDGLVNLADFARLALNW